MADFVTVLAIGIPATAVAVFALFLIYSRGESVLLRAREGNLLIVAFFVMLAGHLTLLLGVTAPDAGLTSAGWLLIGLGIALACGVGMVLVHFFENLQKEQARASAAASLTKAQVQAISSAAEATGIGLMLVERGKDGVDRVAVCNQPAAALIGVEQKALIGEPIEAILVPEEREPLRRLAERARSHPGEPLSAGFMLAPRRAVAERVPVELGLTYEPSEGLSSLAVTLVDARAKRTAIAAAREARSDADFYLDLVTHDLSNFNQGALGYLELIELDKGASPEKQARFEANALKQIRSSARLIENVKTLSVIRESREPLAPTDALYALHDAIDHIVFSWTEKDVEVRLVPMTELHTVQADSWLRDLFSHLLDNAVRYTAGRRVEVAVSVAEGEAAGSLVFRIADSGRGISPAERGMILDRLASRKSDYAAYRAGIGLFIVKTIADRYGGRLWIEDRVPGDHTRGSVFCLDVPRG